jgi:hypothetical protein
LVLDLEKFWTEDPGATYITIRKLFKLPCAITIARLISQASFFFLKKKKEDKKSSSRCWKLLTRTDKIISRKMTMVRR